MIYSCEDNNNYVYLSQFVDIKSSAAVPIIIIFI